MNLRFFKMHGLGNDFVVIDAINQQVTLSTEQIRYISDRHFGVGCDQLLLVEAPQDTAADFRYRIFNADGGEVEQCGNGARCFARFVREQGMTDKDIIAVETLGGLIELRITPDGQVCVDMGEPRFAPETIPFQATEQATRYALDALNQTLTVGVVSMGNPHTVLVVDDIDSAPVATLGPAIESHPCFPNRVNVGFMQVLARDEIRLRVFERGAGETLACGTGACAAVVVGQRQGLLDPTVTVHLTGGDLVIGWQGEGHSVLMTGPAVTVFEGTLTL